MSRDGADDGTERKRRLKRAQNVWPRPLRDLKDLLYQAYLDAGAPSLDQIRADIVDADAEDRLVDGSPSRDTVRRCISDPDLPPKQADVVSVAVVLARRAARSAEELAERVRALWVEAWMYVPAGRPIAEYDDQLVLDDLEVHPALVAEGADDSGVLTAYVRREFDTRLDAVVAAAASGRSGIAFLVGDSSTGKTRACWEAAKQLPDGWRLWHPVAPDRAPAVIEQLQQVGRRSVVWLNEAQHYLLDEERGPSVASGLRELLNDPDRAPVLVLGTIWREHWETLTAAPDGRRDPHAQARHLLKDRGISVPAAFAGEGLRAVGEASRGDARLAEAYARAEQGQIIQYLAGGPALLQRYHTAPDGARALIEAAMDARRLGHGELLAPALLEAAAPGYLTDQQWDTLPEGWQRKAWAYVTDQRACRGARSPLYRRRPRDGRPGDAPVGYFLTDYLEQHGREGRHTAPAALWNAFPDFASREDLTALGRAAQNRGLLREASLAYAAAARAGQPGAAWSLATMLERSARLDEAARWFQWCAQNEADEDAYARLALLADRAGPAVEEGVIRWLRERIESSPPVGSDTGTQAALEALAHLLADGRRDELNEVLSNYFGLRDEIELREMGDRLWLAVDEPFDDWDDEPYLGARSGPNPLIWWAGGPLVNAGRLDEAIRHYQAYSGESVYATRQAVRLMEEQGRQDEALSWLWSELRSGNDKGLWIGVEVLRRMGRDTDAQHLHAYGVAPEGAIAQPWKAPSPEEASDEQDSGRR